MAINIVRIRLLLSSPGNLSVDRKIVCKVIDELNLDRGSREGFHVEVVDWKTHTWPAAGEYAQAVINEQFPQDIDIYLGMMGTYFGTPTKRWGSGTEEEFRIAFDSWVKGGRPQIMFYFSNSVSDLGDVDPEQLSKRKSFQREIGELGVKYEEYSDATRLIWDLRRHLSRAIDQLFESNDRDSLAQTAPEESVSVLNNFEALIAGDPLVAADDLARRAADDMKSHAAGLSRLNKATTTLASKLNIAAKRLVNAGNSGSPKEFNSAIEKLYEAMGSYQSCLLVEIPELEEKFSNSLGAIQRVIDIVRSEKLQDTMPLELALTPMEGMREAYASLREALAQASEHLDSADVGAGDIDIQRRRILALLKDLDGFLSRAVDLISEVSDYYRS